MKTAASAIATPSVLAREVWGLMAEYVMRNIPFPRIAAEFDLSPPQAKLLQMMDADAGMAMSAAAEKLACDASNVTGITDRLETRGLIERRPADRDRRVKMLHLTSAGAELRTKLRERLFQPPESFGELSEEELRTLRGLLESARGSSADH